MLLPLAHLKPVFDEDDAIVLQKRLKRRAHAEEVGVLLVAAKTHYTLNERAIVPAAIENCDFASRRHFLHVTLCIQLRLFTLVRRRQCDVAKHTWTDAFHQPMDHPAL